MYQKSWLSINLVFGCCLSSCSVLKYWLENEKQEVQNSYVHPSNVIRSHFRASHLNHRPLRKGRKERQPTEMADLIDAQNCRCCSCGGKRFEIACASSSLFKSRMCWNIVWFFGNLKILSPTPPIFLMLYVKGQFTQGRAQAEQRTHKVQLLVIPCSHKMYRDFVLP